MNELKEIREKVRELIYELLKIEETLMKIVDKQTIEEEADKVYFAVPFELKEQFKQICAKHDVKPVWDFRDKMWFVQAEKETIDKIDKELDELKEKQEAEECCVRHNSRCSLALTGDKLQCLN